MTDTSVLNGPGWPWHSVDDYRKSVKRSELPLQKFREVTDLLLDNPNLNSSHLFRADILSDSSGKLKTKVEREKQLRAATHTPTGQATQGAVRTASISASQLPLLINSVPPYRTVLRELIPRNQNLDKPLRQLCHFFALEDATEVVVYVPDVEDENQLPWYHPRVRALAYLYESRTEPHEAVVSVHYSLFEDRKDQPIPDRLHRTLLSLLSTFLRLCRYNGPSNTSTILPEDSADVDLRPSAIKDTIVPQHTVQDTYARLKTTYAAPLIAAWVEATPPEKHVFEDLAIAAFLVCLWEKMYGLPSQFPGFVDMACGNGLLVHILIQEGWTGIGLDARRRKTWASLSLGDHVQESVIVPQPFLETLDSTINDAGEAILNNDTNTRIHNGIFKPGTFLISNHADELTIWTPILSVLSSPSNPLPFLNIPCCSHALSGEKHRYSPKEARLDHVSTPSNTLTTTTTHNDPRPHTATKPTTSRESTSHNDEEQAPQQINNTEPQPSSGSLANLRAEKARSTNSSGTEDKSMYACLTRKAIQIARQLGVEVKCTLMRIPSTRNIGIVSLGGHGDGEGSFSLREEQSRDDDDDDDGDGGKDHWAQWRQERLEQIIERECRRSGGLQRSAEVWVERARKLHAGGGGGGERGKVNLGGPQRKKEQQQQQQ